MSGSLVSKAIDLGSIGLGSIQAIYSGAPVGDMEIQLSNDIIAPSADPDVAIVNWIPYSGSQVSIVAAGSYLYNISNMGYKWARISYVPTGGTGVLDLTVAEKNA